MSSELSPVIHDRQQLELELREQMQVAEKAYREASTTLAKTMADYGNMLDDPNGAHAVHKATAAERIALENYTHSLKTFCDLVIHGRRPFEQKKNGHNQSATA